MTARSRNRFTLKPANASSWGAFKQNGNNEYYDEVVLCKLVARKDQEPVLVVKLQGKIARWWQLTQDVIEEIKHINNKKMVWVKPIEAWEKKNGNKSNGLVITDCPEEFSTLMEDLLGNAELLNSCLAEMQPFTPPAATRSSNSRGMPHNSLPSAAPPPPPAGAKQNKSRELAGLTNFLKSPPRDPSPVGRSQTQGSRQFAAAQSKLFAGSSAGSGSSASDPIEPFDDVDNDRSSSSASSSSSSSASAPSKPGSHLQFGSRMGQSSSLWMSGSGRQGASLGGGSSGYRQLTLTGASFGTTRSLGERKGFKNLGNSCYMNAILQTLIAIPTFVRDLTNDALVGGKPEIALRTNSFYQALVVIVNQVKTTDHGVIDILSLKDAIGSRYKRFAGYAQQDAHEFLSECLNQLNEDIFAALVQDQAAHPEKYVGAEPPAAKGKRKASAKGKAKGKSKAAAASASSSSSSSSSRAAMDSSPDHGDGDDGTDDVDMTEAPATPSKGERKSTRTRTKRGSQQDPAAAASAAASSSSSAGSASGSSSAADSAPSPGRLTRKKSSDRADSKAPAAATASKASGKAVDANRMNDVDDEDPSPAAGSSSSPRGNGSGSDNDEEREGDLAEAKAAHGAEQKLSQEARKAIHDRLLQISPVTQNFLCNIEFTIECTNADCSYSRNTREAFYDLSLDFPDDSKGTFATARVATRSANNSSSSSAAASKPGGRSKVKMLPPAAIQRPKAPQCPEDSQHPLMSLKTTKSGVNAGRKYFKCFSAGCKGFIWEDTWHPVLEASGDQYNPIDLSFSPQERDWSSGRVSMSSSQSSNSSAGGKENKHTNSSSAVSSPGATSKPSLSSLLARFFQSRMLECNCSKCSNDQAHQSSKILTLPRVLILHLKRFQPNFERQTYEKRTDQIIIDRQLDLSQFCSEHTCSSDDPRALELFSPHIDLAPSPQHLNGAGSDSDSTASASSSSSSSNKPGGMKRLLYELDAQHIEMSPSKRARREGVPAPQSAKEEETMLMRAMEESTAAASARSKAPTVGGGGGFASGAINLADEPSSSPPSSTPASPASSRNLRKPEERKPTLQALAQGFSWGDEEAEQLKRAIEASLKDVKRQDQSARHAPGSPGSNSHTRSTRRGASSTRAVDKSRLYNLLCIVQHKGSAAYSGHYVADILHSDNTWKRYDDQFVTPVDEAKALGELSQKEGYIFMYVRSDLRQ